ncbi:D-isomer specific 2-hydroxyacid dehydrogenase, NAD-binding domain, partial [Dillenia turbinata]
MREGEAIKGIIIDGSVLFSLAVVNATDGCLPQPNFSSAGSAILISVSNGDMQNIKGMAIGTEDGITRVLFCGPHFPASHNYTRAYLSSYPYIQLDSNIISRAKKMKLIMQYGVGLEGVEINAATKCGIKVARIPGGTSGNAASCAEMAIYLMIGLLRKQNEMQISIKEKKLGEPIGETLLGKTVIILGFGSIGISLAKRLKAFGVKIIATKRSWSFLHQDSDESNGFNCGDRIDDLVDKKGCHEDICDFARSADIAGIVNKTFISSMKRVFFFIIFFIFLLHLGVVIFYKNDVIC